MGCPRQVPTPGAGSRSIAKAAIYSSRLAVPIESNVVSRLAWKQVVPQEPGDRSSQLEPRHREIPLMTPPLNRRDFLAQATAASRGPGGVGLGPWGGAVATAKSALPAGPTAKVTLGKSGVQVSLVGMGTGSVGSGQSSNQTKLGVKGFTKVVRHALDQGRQLLRRRRPVRLARVPPRGPQGGPPRPVRDPDQDPRHRRDHDPRPPEALPA